MSRIRSILSITVLAVPLLLGGCSDSSLGGPDTRSAAENSELTIGLMLPKSGPYKAIGDDMARGWQLYLDTHGGKLGGHSVKVVDADEGDGGQSARTAMDKLIKQDKVIAVVGTASADAVANTAESLNQARVPLIGTGGRPTNLTDISYIWHTSFVSTDYGQAVGAFVSRTVDGPVYVIGPDYQGGKDQIGGFVDAFTAAGGRLANENGQPDWTPWPGTNNFSPTLTKIRSSGAKAVYAFYAGSPAVAFVKQYQQFGVGLPLYGPAFLTEGATLAAAGPAAAGITTVSNYTPTLSSPTNTRFVAAYQAAFKTAPTIYAVATYDGAAVLDNAIKAAGPKPTAERINAAIRTSGGVDSPRGTWKFGDSRHAPIQTWHLRQVQSGADGLANVVIEPNIAIVGA